MRNGGGLCDRESIANDSTEPFATPVPHPSSIAVLGFGLTSTTTH